MAFRVTYVEVGKAFAYNETGRPGEIGAGELIEGVMLIVLFDSLAEKLNVVIDGGASGGPFAGQIDGRQVRIGEIVDVAGEENKFSKILFVLGLDAG